MFKTVGKIIRWLAVSLVLGIAAFFLCNQFDETLQPDAAALLQPPVSSVDPQHNAYFTLIGLSASSGVDATAWGQKIAKLTRTEPLVLMPLPKPVCDLDTHHCLRLARQQPDVLQQALLNQQLLQTRYLTARQFTQFEEVVGQAATDPLPNFSAAFRAQTLRHAQIGLWVEAGNIPAVLDELAADMAFQRQCLAGAKTLIGKMVSLAALLRDYTLLADLMREHLLTGHTVRVMALLQPLTAAERNMLPAIQHEFRVFVGALRGFRYDFVRSELGYSVHTFDALLNPLADSLLLPNATINRLYRLEQADEALAMATPAHFAQAYSAAQDLMMQFSESRWDRLYNPVGKILIDIGRADYHRYIHRPLEANAFIYLLNLHWQILEQKIPDAAIPAFLAAHPFEGKAVLWDAPRHELFIATPQNSAIQYARFGKGHQRIAVPL